jgi:hypothetical protein
MPSTMSRWRQPSQGQGTSASAGSQRRSAHQRSHLARADATWAQQPRDIGAMALKQDLGQRPPAFAWETAQELTVDSGDQIGPAARTILRLERRHAPPADAVATPLGDDNGLLGAIVLWERQMVDRFGEPFLEDLPREAKVVLHGERRAEERRDSIRLGPSERGRLRPAMT